MKKRELVDHLKRFYLDTQSKFSNDICDGWILEGFLNQIKDDIFDIENEIQIDEELD